MDEMLRLVGFLCCGTYIVACVHAVINWPSTCIHVFKHSSVSISIVMLLAVVQTIGRALCAPVLALEYQLQSFLCIAAATSAAGLRLDADGGHPRGAGWKAQVVTIALQGPIAVNIISTTWVVNAHESMIKVMEQ